MKGNSYKQVLHEQGKIHIIYIIKLYQLKHSNPISDNCILRSNKVSSPHSRSMILLYTLHILISAVHFYKSSYTHNTKTAFQTASYRNSLGMSLTCTYSLWLYFFFGLKGCKMKPKIFSVGLNYIQYNCSPFKQPRKNIVKFLFYSPILAPTSFLRPSCIPLPPLLSCSSLH